MKNIRAYLEKAIDYCIYQLIDRLIDHVLESAKSPSDRDRLIIKLWEITYPYEKN